MTIRPPKTSIIRTTHTPPRAAQKKRPAPQKEQAADSLPCISPEETYAAEVKTSSRISSSATASFRVCGKATASTSSIRFA
jgi:hypothetical protein